MISRGQGPEQRDAEALIALLVPAGWEIHRLDRAGDPAAASELVRREGIELAVCLSAGGEDVLELAPLCTALRRLADPPVILLCDFACGDPAQAAAALGADAVVRNAEELVRQAGLRAPDAGRRRWGLRLSRSAGTLVLAPTGHLDRTSVTRLTDVVISRAGSFDRIVLDLRDLAEIESSGVQELARCSEQLAPAPVLLMLMADEGARRRLAATDVTLALPVLEGLPA